MAGIIPEQSGPLEDQPNASPFPKVEGPSENPAPPIAEESGRGDMEVDGGPVEGEGPQPMTLDRIEDSGGEGPEEEMEGDDWLNKLLFQSQCEAWNNFCLREVVMDTSPGNPEERTTFEEKFGGMDIVVHVPDYPVDELTGLAMSHSQVAEGMRTEVKQLERLQVGKCLLEAEGREMAKVNKVQVLTSRWVITQKTADLARCRLVVRDFASGGESAFKAGIYAPTSSLDSLRCVLAWAAVLGYSLLTGDVSVAFMYAPVEFGAVDLVLLPPSILSRQGYRIVLLLQKAMNGLRRAPLLWFQELQRQLEAKGGQATFEPTLFRVPSFTTPGEFILLLVYVDDLLLASKDPLDNEKLLESLQEIWKIKKTGTLKKGCTGALEFLGRTIYRGEAEVGSNAILFGVSRKYMQGIFESWSESLKAPKESTAQPKMEEVYSSNLKASGDGAELSDAATARYRRVLGQLAWAALSRADLAFPISFLARRQSKPNSAAEATMRVFLRWLLGHLHFVQRMPASNPPMVSEERTILGFCDASWSVDSVSGGIICWQGCCLKFFSRKQEVPALSSAEAEVIAITEAAKEEVSLGMLIETIRDGIELDDLGMPKRTTGTMDLVLYNDAKAAISIGNMSGLLRRVRHLELRALYLQHLARKRLHLQHWSGSENPSDGLTKSCKQIMMWVHLCETSGLVPGLSEQESQSIRQELRRYDEEFTHLFVQEGVASALAAASSE